MILAKSTWKEVSEFVNGGKETVVAVLPLGATEQHGLHLPLNTDIFCSEQFTKLALERADAAAARILLLPSLPYGFSATHMTFAGTISLTAETFIAAVKDICRCVIRHGIKKILLLNGHAGNTASLGVAITQLNLETGAAIILVNWWDLCADAIKSNFGFMFHACETESSVALALGQEVRLERAKGNKPTSDIGFVHYNMVAEGTRVTSAIRIIDELSEAGAVGAPEKLDLNKGRAIVDIAAERLSRLLLEFAQSRETSSRRLSPEK